MGSAGVVAWFGHLAFWGLLLRGWLVGGLGLKATVVFLALWLAGLFGLPYLSNGSALFAPFVAMLDVALVFTIFKGDIRLT